MCSTFKGVRFEHNDHKSNSTLNGSETLLDRLTQSDASVRNTTPITNRSLFALFFRPYKKCIQIIALWFVNRIKIQRYNKNV